MADTYEKDLIQKTSLTMSDHVRVVGADNASYKQLMSDVAEKIVENYTGSSLGGAAQSVKGAIDGLKTTTNGLTTHLNEVDETLTQEISDRTAQGESLQTQITQIVAPSGSAPNPAEVENARIGVDNTVYDTLGNAIRTQINNLDQKYGPKYTNVQTQVDELEEELERDYAKKSGYYETLGAGTSGNARQILTDVATEDQVPYKYRVTDGDTKVGNREYLDAIVGGTVAWNQLVNKAGFAPTSTINGITYTNNGDGSITVNGTSTARSNLSMDSTTAVAGHIYLATGSAPNPAFNTHYISILEYEGNTYKRSFGVYGGRATFIASENTNRIVLEIVGAQTQGYEAVNLKFTLQLFDLTQMFGSTIADYIYSLETATAGAGVAFFRKLFNKPYYAYNAGELKSVSGLVSHDMTGFNQFDGEWSEQVVNSWRIAKNYMPVVAGGSYYAHTPNIPSGEKLHADYYDADKNLVSSRREPLGRNAVFTVPSNACFAKLALWYDFDYSDICINISWDGSRNGEYEPYELHSYPLDSSLELRGIPKLDANNNLYYDGDIYEADGTVTRKWGVVTFDGSSDEDWTMYGGSTGQRTTVGVENYTAPSNDVVSPLINDRNLTPIRKEAQGAATMVIGGSDVGSHRFMANFGLSTLTEIRTWLASNPLTVVYPLDVPTTEEAQPYQPIQICDSYGTEEFVTDSIVPVGHITRYPEDLVGKLEELPAIPNVPTTAGTYILKATVTDGAVIYTWIKES